MKKKFFSIVIVLSVMFTNTASAMTQNDIIAKIILLQSQVAVLQAQLAEQTQRVGLIVSIPSTPSTRNQIRGTTFVVLPIWLRSSPYKGVKVTSVTIQGYVDTDSSGSFVSGSDGVTAITDDVLQTSLWDGSTQVGSTKSPTTSTTTGVGGVLKFSSLNYKIAAGESKKLLLKITTPSTAKSNSRIKFAVSEIKAQDERGNTIITKITDASNGATADFGIITVISSSGTLFVSKADDDMESSTDFATAGAVDIVLGKFKFTASNEELMLINIEIGLATNANYRSVLTLQLFDGETPISSRGVVNSSGVVSFHGDNFLIPKDESKTLTVKAVLSSTIDPCANIKVVLISNNLVAVGTRSGTVLRPSGGVPIIFGNSKIIDPNVRILNGDYDYTSAPRDCDAAFRT